MSDTYTRELTPIARVIAYINTLIPILLFLHDVIFGSDIMQNWGLALMGLNLGFVVLVGLSDSPTMVREIEAPQPVDPDADWRRAMELEHEFGLPHYDETLRFCPYPRCLPRVWDDAQVEDEIMATAKMQLEAGVEDSSEIRVLRFYEYEFQCDEAAKRKAEIMAEWEEEEKSESALKNEVAAKQKAAYQEELYQEALQGLRAYGWDWVPDFIDVQNIYGDEGLKRQIYTDATGVMSVEQMVAINRAAETFRAQQYQIADAQKVLREKIAGCNYQIGQLPASILDVEENRLRESERKMLEYKTQTELMQQAINALAQYGILSPNEARKRGYEKEEA